MRKTMILLLFSFLLVACSDSPVCYYLDATNRKENKRRIIVFLISLPFLKSYQFYSRSCQNNQASPQITQIHTVF